VTDQREAIAGVFDRAAETYDQGGVEFFGAVGRHLVRDAGLSPGQRVLDVGCGRGAVLFPAAAAVGESGSVLGIDLAPSMVALTAADAAAHGVGNVETAVMDAQEPDLEAAAFDAVLSSLVLFFLPDPTAALRSWRAATRDDGRLGITTFAGRDDERWSWLNEVFPTRDPKAGTPDAEERSPFDSIDGVHGLLDQARWVSPSTVEREQVVRFDDAEQWLQWSWSHGMRMFWERTPEDRRAEVRTQALAELATMHERYGELSVRMQVRYTTARAGS
jgi:ubiquinone/menaquinone biosynthesis C-methylase UbiE